MGTSRPRHRIRVGGPPLPDSGLRRRRVDAPGGRSGVRGAVPIVLAALCLAPGAWLAAPDDAFGPAAPPTPGSLDALHAATYCDATSGTLIAPAGSTGGCVPSTSDNPRCSDAVRESLNTRRSSPPARAGTPGRRTPPRSSAHA